MEILRHRLLERNSNNNTWNYRVAVWYCFNRLCDIDDLRCVQRRTEKKSQGFSEDRGREPETRLRADEKRCITRALG
jgi:hypothetical protein